MSREIERFKRERNEALLRGDDAVRAFCRKWNIPYSKNPEVLERARLKAITGVPSLPIEIRKDAKRRLDVKRSQSFDDGDL